MQRSLLAYAATGITLKQGARELGFTKSHAYNELQRIKVLLASPTLPSCVAVALCRGEITGDPTGTYFAPACEQLSEDA